MTGPDETKRELRELHDELAAEMRARSDPIAALGAVRP